MGDVVQPISMENLLAAALPEEQQCFYYSHPVGEDPSRGSSIGEFFGKDKSRVIPLGRDSAWKVSPSQQLWVDSCYWYFVSPMRGGGHKVLGGK